MDTNLSKKITPWFLIKFTAPTVLMMVFMSLYTMVDGAFVSQFVGTDALSAVNIVFPAFNVVLAIGIMLATGASAVCATQMGQGKAHRARQSFSLIVFLGIAIGILVLVLGAVFRIPLVKALGAGEKTLAYCISYISWLLPFTPFAILQILFQYFFVTAGKPTLGLAVTVIGGVANIVLDYVFIVPLDMGIAGAAIATGIGLCIPAIVGLVYFTFVRNGVLYFVKPKADLKVIWQSCSNGSSEMVTNLASAITTFLFNITMLRLVGEDGVAAVTIILYAQFFLTAIFLGYSSGVAPLFSYNNGCQDIKQIKKLFSLSSIFLVISSIGAYVVALALANPIVSIFAKQGTPVFDLALSGFNVAALAFIVMGINIFASAMFTAFSNGLVSAIISFLRTFVFLAGSIIILPQIMGLTGVWLAVPIAEALTVVVSIFFFIRYKKIYKY